MTHIGHKFGLKAICLLYLYVGIYQLFICINKLTGPFFNLLFEISPCGLKGQSWLLQRLVKGQELFPLFLDLSYISAYSNSSDNIANSIPQKGYSKTDIQDLSIPGLQPCLVIGCSPLFLNYL